jgi:hypothetical protein
VEEDLSSSATCQARTVQGRACCLLSFRIVWCSRAMPSNDSRLSMKKRGVTESVDSSGRVRSSYFKRSSYSGDHKVDGLS